MLRPLLSWNSIISSMLDTSLKAYMKRRFSALGITIIDPPKTRYTIFFFKIWIKSNSSNIYILLFFISIPQIFRPAVCISSPMNAWKRWPPKSWAPKVVVPSSVPFWPVAQPAWPIGWSECLPMFWRVACKPVIIHHQHSSKYHFQSIIDPIISLYSIAPAGTYGGIRDVFAELMRKEGPLALYKGVTPVMLRAFPANAACFIGFEICMNFLNIVAPNL